MRRNEISYFRAADKVAPTTPRKKTSLAQGAAAP